MVAEVAQKFEGAVEIDEFVVMPNHVHGIVRLTRGALATDGEGGGAAPPLRQTASPTGEGGGAAPPLRTSEISLPRVVQWFKAMTSSEFLRDAKARGAPMGAGRLWQRGYYEHVVRDDRDLDRIRQYIIDNPRMWAEDDENPNR